jgi:hypothetical protein
MSALKMEVVRSFEKLAIFYKTTRLYLPEEQSRYLFMVYVTKLPGAETACCAMKDTFYNELNMEDMEGNGSSKIQGASTEFFLK